MEAFLCRVARKVLMEDCVREREWKKKGGVAEEAGTGSREVTEELFM